MTETTHSTGPRWGAWPMTARTNEKSIATSTTTLTVRHVSTAQAYTHHGGWVALGRAFLSYPFPQPCPFGNRVLRGGSDEAAVWA
jgi:hypothetical protein